MPNPHDFTDPAAPAIADAQPARRRRAGFVTAAGVGLAAAGLLVGPAIAGAQQDDPAVDVAEPTDVGGSADLADRPGIPFGDVFESLVDDGTITQEQADAIIDRIGDHLAEHGDRPRFGGPHGPGMGGPPGDGPMGFDPGIIEDVLGLSADEIRDARRDGTTLAELAEANGVDADELVDALVGAAQDRLDEAVTDGRLDADRAAELAAGLESRLTDLVENGFDRGPGPRFGHGPDDTGEDRGE